MDIDDLGESDSPSSNRRRHKHKKHKRRKIRDDSEGSVDMSMDEENIKVKSPPPMLPIEKTKLIKTESKPVTPPTVTTPINAPPLKANTAKKKRTRGRDSGTSSEEERWLDAIESGKLEDVDDELKKIKPKDPKLMTARQRAMYERGTDKEASPSRETLMSLPTGYKEKVMTAEAIQKAALKSQKRKQLADEKREKDKKRTMERLLKKQETKINKSAKMKAKRNVPLISYKQNLQEITLSFPETVEFDMRSKLLSEQKIPERILCGVAGCKNPKKYACSITKVPLCSLQCYKMNIR
ncbi:INO80 complex subunit B [Chrysoperla carnea]|uniref:INO80 complex subunit B n=1 Tax=Chrysoperla carnea TaxID=189513 RepID=UPI001D098F28|nr:INO80 complex subunit B [Chrysoperla carnea]